MSQEDAAGEPPLPPDPVPFSEEAPDNAVNLDTPPSAASLSQGVCQPELIIGSEISNSTANESPEPFRNQLEDVIGDQVTECSESVSLEPEAVEQEVEPSEQSTSKSWGGWGSWGKSLLTSATSTVGQGLNSVRDKAGVAFRIRTVSSCEEAEENQESCVKEEASAVEPSSPANKGVLSSITNAVQNTGKSVLTGGLDALEFIGRKTMTVLAESDPGFKKTKILMQRTVSLSQMLKEAKEKAREQSNRQALLEPTAHYGILFDDYQGLSHLEALEILSNESEGRVQDILACVDGEQLELLKRELIELKEIFEMKEEEGEKEEEVKEEEKAESGGNAADGEEFVSVLTELLFELHVAATPDKLNKARLKAYDWMRELENPVSTEVNESAKDENSDSSPAGLTECSEEHQERDGQAVEEKTTEHSQTDKVERVYLCSIGSLAEVTARSIEQLHKIAELILHGQDEEKPASQQARILSRLTCAMCKEVGCLTDRFSHTLLNEGNRRKAEELNPLVNSVMHEGSNSTTYIQNAFHLVLPVLQVSHLQTRGTPSTIEDKPNPSD